MERYNSYKRFYHVELGWAVEDGIIQPSAGAWAQENLDYLNRPMNLLGSSIKTEKGSDKYETYIMYLQPASKVSVDTLCAGAAASGCEGPCLISSGQLGMTVGQRAATKRTLLYLLKIDYFHDRLLFEIDRAEAKARKTGVPCVFRLNGTSDIDFNTIIRARPESQFYDYTKILSRIRKNKLPNYDLTFSGSMYSTQSKRALSRAVKTNLRVAIAYNTKNLPSDNVKIHSSLVSFDDTDHRFRDGAGVIGALKRKGSNKRERSAEGYKSFFVTRDNEKEFLDIIAKAC